MKEDALVGQLCETPIEDSLLELESRDAIAQQSADPVGSFKDMHLMPGSTELLRRREACRTRSHDRHATARVRADCLADDPAFVEAAVHDGLLDGAYGHRCFDEPEHAR